MSNLLNEAIVDAKALKEAALKNAESAVIEKYSAEVKQTLDALLEQEAALDAAAPAPDPSAEAPMMGVEPEGPPVDGLEGEGGEQEELLPDISLSAVDGIEGSPGEGEPVEFELDLQTLQEAVIKLQSELSEDEEIEINEAELDALLSEDDEEITEDAPPGVEQAAMAQAADEQEDSLEGGDKDDESSDEKSSVDSDVMGESDTDELLDAIMEKLTVDMGADLAGWAGRSSEDKKYQMEKEMAHRRSTEVEEELEVLKKAQEEVVFENNQLKDRLSQYEGVVGQLKESLHDVNLSNARLLYTNRVLRNTSLNERQKEKVVEAISNAGSVIEARTIFDTLESTVQSTPKRGPQSLSEAITRRSSVIRATRKESTSSDPVSDRMKKLAGIKQMPNTINYKEVF